MTQPEPMTQDEALAMVLSLANWDGNTKLAHVDLPVWRWAADAILASDWLAAREATARAEGRAEGRRDALNEVLEAAHSAADELDEWDGHASPGLSGCSPGGVVRQDVHRAAGLEIDDCPACTRRALAEGGLVMKGIPERSSREHLSMERSWRDGLDLLDDLLDDCAQGGDESGAVCVWAVRAVVQSIRAYEDDTDESIRQAAMEDWIIQGGHDE